MVSQGCVLFRGDHEEALEKIFIERDKALEMEQFVEWVCGNEVTKACNKVEPESLRKPVFYLDGVAQDPSMITMGYGPPPGSEQDL